jgi:hypothetical protein
MVRRPEFLMLPSLRAVRTSPVAFLATLYFVNWLGFASWSALINNFSVDAAGVSWNGIGLMQSVREIPGFLAFTAIFWILWFREQTFAYMALLTLGFGIALTGYFPSMTGLLITTFIMSVGFHYLETMNQSLSLQLLDKRTAPADLGRIAAAGATAQFIAYGALLGAAYVGYTSYQGLFVAVGVASMALTLLAWTWFRKFDGTVPQRKSIILRQRYWLFYALTFMSGARRQIFTAFAAFLLVKNFGYTIFEISLLFLLTAALNTVLAPRLGAAIGRIGERNTIIVENLALLVVFTGYALASNGVFGQSGAAVAGALYVLDGVFITLSIAQRTYFQKIGDAADMAPTAAVSFTINHIMAVIIPVAFGLLAVSRGDPAIIFWLGCVIALISLALAFLVPHDPSAGNETTLRPGRAASAVPAE